MGRPGTLVFSDDWAATAGAVTAKTLNATVALRHPGTQQAWDADLEQNVQVPLDPYYTGDCAIGAVLSRSQAGVVVAGEDQVDVAGYQILLLRGVAAEEGDLVTVTDTGDATLDDRTLTVREVERASRRFSRLLFCTLTD